MVNASNSTQCETPSAMRKMFDAADKNSDGTLSEAEFTAYLQNNMKRSSLGCAGTAFQDLFNQTDANNDQVIDFNEFQKLACTAAQFVEDVTGADTGEPGPAESQNGCATDVAVTNDTGGGSQGQDSGANQEESCEPQDPLAALINSLGKLGLDAEETLRLMSDNGLVDVDCDNTISANDKTSQFLGQLNQLADGSTEGMNEVLACRIEGLVSHGATHQESAEFLFDQDAIKADQDGNLAFSYPKGMTLNHYLGQMLDPQFRGHQQGGSDSLDPCISAIYDNKMSVEGSSPIEVVNWMLDQDLASVNEKGQIVPTATTGDYASGLNLT